MISDVQQESTSGGWLRAFPFLLLVACIGVGAAICVAPDAALILTGALIVLVGLNAFPPEARILAPLILLLLVPADHILPLSGPVAGVYILIASAFLVASAAIRGRLRWPRRSDWDLYLLIGANLAAIALHIEAGQLRGGLYWTAAVLVLLWLRSVEGVSDRPVRQVLLSFVVLGSVSGILAVLQFLRILDLSEHFQIYQPVHDVFTELIGERAVGVFGHPLRLGTVAMVSALVTTSALVVRERNDEDRLLTVIGCALSMFALLLSGARGAWLGFLLGAAVIGALELRANWILRSARIVAIASVAAALVYLSGLDSLVGERLFGSAVHPASLSQRVDALQGVADTWSSVPLLGVGPGGTADLAHRMGLRIPNLENEYVIALFSMGILGPLLLLIVGVRRTLFAVRAEPSWLRSAMTACLVALFVNLATYNLFSWSAAPALFVTMAALPSPRRSEA